MIRLLRFLIFGDGHRHTWKYYGETKFYGETTYSEQLPEKIKHTMICTVCKKTKRVRVA